MRRSRALLKKAIHKATSTSLAPKAVPGAKKFTIMRFNPETQTKPTEETFEVADLTDCPMVLDVLLKIKNQQDPSLTLRRSCREGVCGSCAMNIDGTNGLACTTPVKDDGKAVRVLPLPGMPMIKDLVVDQTNFFKQHKSISPYLIPAQKRHKEEEYLQSVSERKRLDELGTDAGGRRFRYWECIMCGCCTASCPSYWWNPDKYLGPATLLQAYRWILDSRDGARRERLLQLDDYWKLHRCHTIFNCTAACPKGLNPALAIAKIKKEIRELPKEDNRGVLSSSVHSHNPGPGGEIDKDVFDRY